MKKILMSAALFLGCVPAAFAQGEYLQYDASVTIDHVCYSDYVLTQRMISFFDDVSGACNSFNSSYSSHIEIKTSAEKSDADSAIAESVTSDVYYCSNLVGECFGGLHP